MTTQVNIPYIYLEADGSITTFAYSFPIVENKDLLVRVDDVLQVEYSDYTLENVTEDGGEVEFTEAPADGAVVLIRRQTTMTQNVDYESGEPFPAETHEWNLDKITYILQELLQGLLDDGSGGVLSFDLSTEQAEFLLTVLNSGGTDAPLPVWTSNEYAGIYIGETVDVASLPAADSVTTKPDGYIWLGI